MWNGPAEPGEVYELPESGVLDGPVEPGEVVEPGVWGGPVEPGVWDSLLEPGELVVPRVWGGLVEPEVWGSAVEPAGPSDSSVDPGEVSLWIGPFWESIVLTAVLDNDAEEMASKLLR